MQETVDPEESQLRYTEVGVASVLCGVVGLVCFFVMFVVSVPLLHLVVLVLGILAVVLGAMAYWWMKRDSLGLAGFGLGMLLFIIWFLYWMYTSVSGMVHGAF